MQHEQDTNDGVSIMLINDEMTRGKFHPVKMKVVIEMRTAQQNKYYIS